MITAARQNHRLSRDRPNLRCRAATGHGHPPSGRRHCPLDRPRTAFELQWSGLRRV